MICLWTNPPNTGLIELRMSLASIYIEYEQNATKITVMIH